MRTAVYAICYNEEFMLPYFLRHYRKYADTITIWDNRSTDRSVEIMKSHGVKVRSYESGDQIRDDIMLQVKNQFWKPSRFKDDWVIVADIDELIHHADLPQLLSNTRFTVLKPQGFCMLCKDMPSPGDDLTEIITTGAPNSHYDKPCIFRPDCLDEINFQVGGHDADPIGLNVLVGREEGLKLLHYNYLTLDYHLARYQERGKRLSHSNIEHKWGTDYLMTPEELIRHYRKVEANLRSVV